MYFEIIETYPAELFDSTLSFLKIPVQMGTDKLKYEECVKLILKNDSQGTESYNIIEAFLNFCETTLQLKHNDLDTSSLKLDLNTLEENAFVKTNFRAIVSAHLSCHPEVNVTCQGRDSILSTELYMPEYKPQRHGLGTAPCRT